MKFYLLLYVLFSCNVLCTFYLNSKFSRKMFLLDLIVVTSQIYLYY